MVFQDNKADLVINYYVDDILEKVMNILGLDIPTYNEADDLSKMAESAIIDWTINRKDVLALEKIFKAKCKGVKKKRSLIKSKRNSAEPSTNSNDDEVDDKSKIIKLEVQENSITEGITANGDVKTESVEQNGTEQNQE